MLQQAGVKAGGAHVSSRVALAGAEGGERRACREGKTEASKQAGRQAGGYTLTGRMTSSDRPQWLCLVLVLRA
jgi:hypothetical protein